MVKVGTPRPLAEFETFGGDALVVVRRRSRPGEPMPPCGYWQTRWGVTPALKPFDWEVWELLAWTPLPDPDLWRAAKTSPLPKTRGS